MNSRTIIVIGASFAGIHAAWELRNRLAAEHNILVFSDQSHTVPRASFPRVVFEDVSLDEMTIDLQANFEGTGITFIHEALVSIQQETDKITTSKTEYEYDYLVLATGARHAYEVLPGSREHSICICDRDRIMETKEKILDFKGGIFYAGVGAGYTPCDGPPMEILMGLDHRLRELGIRDKAELHYVSDKDTLLPPTGPEGWAYVTELFKRREIHVHLDTLLVKLDEKFLHYDDGSTHPYDLCVLVPPYRGARCLEGSGLTNERGFIMVNLASMRAEKSSRYNIYAVGDTVANPGPKQGHIAMMQADIAAAHIAWRINRGGDVPAYLPEFKCVMDQGGGNGLYIYSQWMSDGDVIEIVNGPAPYQSKIDFEKAFYAERGNIGSLYREIMK